jgi:hypothetical protein
VNITVKSYLAGGNWYQHSYALYRALNNIKDSCRDIYKLNDIPSDYYSTDIYQRLRAVIHFVQEATNLIAQQKDLPITKRRIRGTRTQKDLCDHIADLMFEIIFSAAYVEGPPDKCWTIHYNTVWDEFFGISQQGKAWNIIQFKLRRLLYDEIVDLTKSPDYKSSHILGFCLNVMGLKIGEKQGIDKNDYPLHKALLAWTRNNYLRLKTIHPAIARSCLLGSISFEEQSNRLVKTYFKGLELEAPKDYLDLCLPPDPSEANYATGNPPSFSTA